MFFDYLDECRRTQKKKGQFGSAKKSRIEVVNVEARLPVKKLPSWDIKENTLQEQESDSFLDLLL